MVAAVAAAMAGAVGVTDVRAVVAAEAVFDVLAPDADTVDEEEPAPTATAGRFPDEDDDADESFAPPFFRPMNEGSMRVEMGLRD